MPPRTATNRSAGVSSGALNLDEVVLDEKPTPQLARLSKNKNGKARSAKAKSHKHYGFPESDFASHPSWTVTSGNAATKGANFNFFCDDVTQILQWPEGSHNRPRWHNDDWAHFDYPSPSESMDQEELEVIRRQAVASRRKIKGLPEEIRCGRIWKDVGNAFFNGWNNPHIHTPQFPVVCHFLQRESTPGTYLYEILSSNPSEMTLVSQGAINGASKYEGDDKDDTHPIATFILSAFRLLEYAPTHNLSYDVELSSDRSAYPHRYPRAEPGDNKAILGYVLEDWARAIVLCMVFCNRRSGKFQIMTATDPSESPLPPPMIYPALVDNSEWLDEEDAGKERATALNRAMLASSVMSHKRTRTLLNLSKVYSVTASGEELSLRTERLLASMQGGTNISECIARQCHSLQLPPMPKLDDATMRILINHLRTRHGRRQDDDDPSIEPTTAERINPDARDKEFQDFFNIGCEDLAEDAQSSKEAADEAYKATFKTWLMNKSLAGDAPNDEGANFEAAAKLLGFENWRELCPNTKTPDYQLTAAQVMGMSPFTLPSVLYPLPLESAPAWILDGPSSSRPWSFYSSHGHIYNLVSKEKSPMRGSMLCSSVGLGKTNCIFGLIAAVASMLEAEFNAGQSKGPFLPTLVICNNANFSQMFDKAKVWDERLKVRLYFSHTKNVNKDSGRSDVTWNKDELDPKIFELFRDGANDPQVTSLPPFPVSLSVAALVFMAVRFSSPTAVKTRAPSRLSTAVKTRAPSRLSTATARTVVLSPNTTLVHRLTSYEFEPIRIRDKDRLATFRKAAKGHGRHPEGHITELITHAHRPVVARTYFKEHEFYPCNTDEAHAYIGSYVPVNGMSGFRRKWHRIIVDEAHCCKNELSALFAFLTEESYAHLTLVTATPMVNHIRDLAAYLRLFHHVVWKARPEGERIWIMPNRTDLGETLLLYLPNYDPCQEQFTVGPRTVRGLFHLATYVDDEGNPYTELPPAIEYAKKVWMETRFPLWILHPGLYKATGARHQWKDEFAQVVVPRVMALIAQRRYMHTPLSLPDGTVTYPAKNMKPYKYVMEELSYPEEDAEEVLNHSCGLLDRTIATGAAKQKTVLKLRQNLRKLTCSPDTPIGGDGGGGGGGGGPAQGNSRNANVQSSIAAGEDESGNNVTFREGMLVAFDLHSMVLQDVEDECNVTLGSLQQKDFDKTFEDLDKARENSANKPDDAPTASKKGKGKANFVRHNVAQRAAAGDDIDDLATIVTLGREHVEELVRTDPYGGLRYLFYLVNKDKDIPEPSDPVQLIKWVCSKSPILARTLEIATKTIREDKSRVFILADIPWQQQIVGAMLAVVGFNVESIRSSHSDRERTVAIDRFNSPFSSCQVLVANFNISLVGLDLQAQCHTGIFVSINWSWAYHEQGGGRLIRLGQKFPVTWHLLKIKNSYYDYMERNLTNKWSHELIGAANIPGHIQGSIRYAVVFEMVRNHIRQPFNRFAWCDGHFKPNELRRYHAPIIVQRGHAYTYLAVWARSLTLDRYNKTFGFAQYGLDPVINGLVKFLLNRPGGDDEPVTFEQMDGTDLAKQARAEVKAILAKSQQMEEDDDGNPTAKAKKLKAKWEKKFESRQSAAMIKVDPSIDNDFDDHFNDIPSYQTRKQDLVVDRPVDDPPLHDRENEVSTPGLDTFHGRENETPAPPSTPAVDPTLPFDDEALEMTPTPAPRRKEAVTVPHDSSEEVIPETSQVQSDSTEVTDPQRTSFSVRLLSQRVDPGPPLGSDDSNDGDAMALDDNLPLASSQLSTNVQLGSDGSEEVPGEAASEPTNDYQMDIDGTQGGIEHKQPGQDNETEKDEETSQYDGNSIFGETPQNPSQELSSDADAAKSSPLREAMLPPPAPPRKSQRIRFLKSGSTKRHVVDALDGDVSPESQAKTKRRKLEYDGDIEDEMLG
ncbi:uncharacterized protein CCOS01_12770 [Colletotrichum costaricense]|uniref:Helicase ATP-binding domain-containing protein n=1 Tax=Colletotrichum costaricense TaxID=1209916 RepID=A0AAJ0DWR2_9PEZI|nr:uncharacterized protein CCOS01_12770 [Colletotrichum costaricense]KAK1517221.1 hypothetical protein CCOS01_12770 [Colletotrichum costaricense]